MKSYSEFPPHCDDRQTVWLTPGAMLHRLPPAFAAGDLEGWRQQATSTPPPSPLRRQDAARTDFAVDHFLTHTLQRRFEVFAQTNPGVVALKTAALTITYGELDAQADGLAFLLQQRGMGPGQICMICMAPSAALARAVLAVLKSGGACVLLDPARPVMLLAAMVEACRPLMILGADTAAHGAAVGGAPFWMCCAEDGAGLPYAWPTEYPTHRLSLACAAAMQTDAGQTRLVFCSHLAVMDRLLAMQSMHAIGQGDAVLQDPDGTPLAFPWEVLWPLSQGARLVVAPASGMQCPDCLRQLIRREHITVMHLAPALQQLLRTDSGAADLATLRALFYTSASLADQETDEAGEAEAGPAARYRSASCN